MGDWQEMGARFARRPGETFVEWMFRRLEWEEKREPEMERDRR
jgi:hypothetical protein